MGTSLARPLDRVYPGGGTDAIIVALAERLEETDIGTLDRTHFTVVRPRHVEAFNLHP
jgi:uncharacterized protein